MIPWCPMSIAIIAQLFYFTIAATDPTSFNAVEDCQEIVEHHQDNGALKFACDNPVALVTTICDAILQNYSRVTLQSTCKAARFVTSFLNNDYIEDSMDSCYKRGRILDKVILNNAPTLKMIDFLMDLLNVYGLKIAVILLDRTSAMPATQLQRRLNRCQMKSVVVNLDNPNFNLDKALITWSNSHNFFVFCNKANQMRLIKAANELGLFGDPYLWMFEEDEQNNVTKVFLKFGVEYASNVNIARILNNATQIMFRKRPAIVTTIDFSNFSNYSQYRDSCVTMDFTNWTRKTKEITRTKNNSDYNGILGYKLFRMHLKCSGAIELQLMASWTNKKSLEVESTISRSINISLNGCHFRIGIVANNPNVILDDNVDPKMAVGIDVDLMKTLADKAEFTYDYAFTNESSIGNFNEDGWSGLIKSLVENDIDLILPSMSITSQREEAMDFTTAIQDIGAVVVIKKPGMEDEIFSDYIQPFANNVWHLIGVMFLVTVVLLTTTYFYSPYGVRVTRMSLLRHQQGNDFNWWNSFYVLLSIMIQQGVDRTPTSISGRIVVASFLLATMILMQNYSSLLVSFLTVNKPLIPFSSLQQLTENKDYSIALVEGSSLLEFFSTSNEPVRKSVWEKITNQGLTKSILPGLDLALETVAREKVALLIRYNAVHDLLLTNCTFHAALKDVIKVSYHIAVRKGFAYTSILSQHITRLRETGVIDNLRKKYRLPGRNTCSSETLSAISIDHITFLLYILAFGFGSTMLLFIFEYLIHFRYGHRGLDLFPGIVNFPTQRIEYRRKIIVVDPAIIKQGGILGRMTNNFYKHRYIIKIENKK